MKTLVIWLCGICLIGCGGSNTPEPADPKEPTLSPYVGRIHSIHPAEQFVLIRRHPGVELAAGTILVSKGLPTTQAANTQRLANLRVSGEALGQMMAADIQSGHPQAGDSVYRPLLDEEGPDAPAQEQTGVSR